MEFTLNENERSVIISDGQLQLNGILGLPEQAKAIIVFAHGSGSGRFSPRNQFVARELQQAQFGTLLLDLLTEEESLDRKNVFDIDLLANRLNTAKAWLAEQPDTNSHKVGFFGASTGAGAAIQATYREPENVFAIVSRGGRPDLATSALAYITIPTLLIVGGNDGIVIDLNREALQQMRCIKELTLVPGATHLFEEPGTLEQVAELAKLWFANYFN
jgi:putative phosphoribosyl transferase